MSSAAYNRVANQTSSPRENEANALLKAAKQLQGAQANWNPMRGELNSALLFNRKLWTILVSAALRDDNPQPIAVRQNIVNIGVFVLTQTVDIHLNPTPEKLRSLIEINKNI